tara:strand:- start:3221 stop:3652 length:432 start_codon:yes stop_codon:yes gene_type:complete
MSVALRPTAYDHDYVEGRIVVMLDELLKAIGVVAGNDESLTEEEHALACYLTFNRHIHACVVEIPAASRLKGKHRTAKRALRSMLSQIKDHNLAVEHDGGGLEQATMLAFGELAIDFLETIHKVMLDDTRQYARDAVVKEFSA